MSKRRVARLHREFCTTRNHTAEAKRARARARSLTDAELTAKIALVETPDPIREQELQGLSLWEISRAWRAAIERS
jgi:hypothetical protein